MYEIDPLNIPDMTASICEHLKEVPADLATKKQLHGLAHLPQEITDLIWQHLCPLSGPPLACTRLISPEQWLYALQNIDVLPWLWNIDTNMLEENKQAQSLDKCWDWESVIRRLAARDTYRLEDKWDGRADGNTRIKVTRSIEGLPPGLRNRRRIWNLAIDMLDELTIDEE